MQLTLFTRIIILIALFTTSYTQAQDSYPENPDITTIQKQAKATQKKMLLIGCTEWCGPCKTLKNEHFKDSTIKAILDKNFVIGSYDMEVGFGITVAKKYAITQFPTLIVLDPNGKMLTRIEGAFAKIEYLSEALTKAANLTESVYPGISTSFNVSFPPFYHQRFEDKTKKKVQQEVMDAYIKEQKDLFSEVNWRVMQVFDAGPVADAFIYDNYPKFKELYGTEARLKVGRIINKRFDAAVSSKDTIQFQKLISFMRDNQFQEKYIQDKQTSFYSKTASGSK